MKLRDTSRAAGEQARQPAKVRAAYALILDALAEHGPLTDERLQHLTSIHPNAIRARRGELADQGLIRRTGLKGRTDAGNKADLWELVPANEIQTDPTGQTLLPLETAA